jgi:nitrate reductase gamma subunit
VTVKALIAAFWKKITADRVGGAVFMLLGVVSLLEARRLRPMRMRAAVGDDIFPLILGVALLLLGALMTFVVKTPSPQPAFPARAIARRMLASLASLLAYWALLPVFGYVPGTFLTSAALFSLFGGYQLRTCLAASALLTAGVYLTFVRLLKMPFPIGVFGL